MRASNKMYAGRILVTLMTIFLMSLTANALVMIELDLKEMVELSEDSVIGTVTETRSYWNEDKSKIYTDISIKVEEPLFGKLAPSSTVTLTLLGGMVDGLKAELVGSPTFHVGDRVLVFLYQRHNGDITVLGFSQGKFDISKDEGTGKWIATRDPALNASGMIKLNEHAESIPASLELDVFVRKIREYALKLKSENPTPSIWSE